MNCFLPQKEDANEEATIAKIYESMIDFSSATLTEDKFDYWWFDGGLLTESDQESMVAINPWLFQWNIADLQSFFKSIIRLTILQ